MMFVNASFLEGKLFIYKSQKSKNIYSVTNGNPRVIQPVNVEFASVDRDA